MVGQTLRAFLAVVVVGLTSFWVGFALRPMSPVAAADLLTVATTSLTKTDPPTGTGVPPVSFSLTYPESFEEKTMLLALCGAFRNLGVRVVCEPERRDSDLFVMGTGYRNFSVFPALEKQLWFKLNATETDCTSRATVLWSGGDSADDCPNVVFLSPALVGLVRSNQSTSTGMRDNVFADAKYESRHKFCLFRGPKSAISSEIIAKLNTYKVVDEGSNHTGPFLFELVVEKVLQRGFVSEKLIEAYAAGRVPVYWGAPNVGDFFNTDAVVLCDDHNVVNCFNRVRVTDNKNAWEAKVSSPLFKGNKPPRWLSVEHVARQLLAQWNLVPRTWSKHPPLRSYETCVKEALPRHFWEGPPADVLANATRHSDWIFSRHSDVLRRMRSYGCELRLVVFECGGGCGGHGDRVKGFLTTYTLALLTSSQFVSHWTQPVDIQEFYEFPDLTVVQTGAHTSGGFRSEQVLALYEKMVPLSRQRRIACGEEGRMFVGHRTGDLFSLLGIKNPKCLGCEDIMERLRRDLLVRVSHNFASWVFLTTNPCFRDVVAMYGLESKKWDEIAFLLGRKFFSRPREALQNITSKVLSGKARPIVGVHMRMGGDSHGKGSWSDPGRHPLAHVRCFAADAHKLCGIIGGGNGTCSFFVASDAPSAIQVFKAELRNIVHSEQVVFFHDNGVLRHHDKSADGLQGQLYKNRVRLWLDSFVDWQVLQNVDAIVASRSGYSETAAWLTGVPYIRFRDKVENCTSSLVTPGAVPLVWYG